MKPTSAQIVWRKYLAEKINEEEYNGKNIYITSEELTLEDIPSSTASDEKVFNFVRTYVPVRDRFDHHLTDLSLYYKDYIYEGKHKNSIQKLRGIMYFIWRADRFTSTFNLKLTHAYYRVIIEDIRTILIMVLSDKENIVESKNGINF